MLMKLELTLALMVGALLIQAAPAVAAKKTPDLVKICKKECPGATDVKTAMECVEKQEHAGGPDEEKFKKTKCYTVHEAHEGEYRKMAGMSVEEGEANEAHHKK